ncbi:MAG: PqqD family protein [Ruminococcaceae bacterium]|nr:PqqD family protein [Oscillospiraceae bacterium]
MKIKEGYIVRKIGSKFYAVSAARAAEGAGMIALNETGAFIWDLLKEENTVEAIAKALTERYEGLDIETATKDTEAYIGMLKEAGALA